MHFVPLGVGSCDNIEQICRDRGEISTRSRLYPALPCDVLGAARG